MEIKYKKTKSDLAALAPRQEDMQYGKATLGKEYYTPIGVMVVVMSVITNDEMAPITVVAKVVDMLCKFSIY